MMDVYILIDPQSPIEDSVIGFVNVFDGGKKEAIKIFARNLDLTQKEIREELIVKQISEVGE